MPPRAIGTATISFGLVSIPIKLFSSNQPASEIRFNLMHEKCGSRLKQQYICPKDEELVPRDKMVKGYEFSKGKYVTFTAEELKAIEQESNRALEITEFVPADKIDWVFFDKSYYLGPDKGGDKAYKLLSRAMQITGRCALARYAARGKQYIVMIRPQGEGLAMQQLRYADEVKPFAEIPLGEAEVTEAELQLAQQLIEQIANDKFEPEKYLDDVKVRVEALIQKKVEGQEITAMPEESPKAQIIDLMEALKASVGDKIAAQPKKKAASKSRKAPKRAPAKTSKAKKKVAK